MTIRSAGQRIFRFAGFKLDLERGLVLGPKGPVTLRAKSFELLTYLVENAGRVLPKEELVAAVWGQIAVTDDSLAQCVHDIRRALGDQQQKLLQTIHRRGYLFVDLTIEPGEGDKSIQAVSATNGGGKPGLVVLPFANVSSDPEQAFFADGVAEEIITNLSKVSGLYVVSRSTAFNYRNRALSVNRISVELGVGHILEGSVRRSGSRVRVSCRLVDGPTQGQVWAESFDRELTDILAIQDEIAVAVTAQLRVKLLPVEARAVSRAATGNIDAYSFYLKGRQFSYEWTKPYTILARRMFSKALELDPAYGRAYAGIASADCYLYGYYANEASFDQIMAMSAKALALDPDLAEAHAARGFALTRQERFGDARVEFEKALSLDPNFYEAHFFYARMAFVRGDYDQAAARFVRAAELRPDDCTSPIHLTACYRALGKGQERLAWASVGVERAERAIVLHPENAGAYSRGALAFAHLGERDRARAWAAQALTLDPGDFVTLYNTACAYSVVGDIEQALDVLERLAALDPPDQSEWFVHDSDLDALRLYPRFQQLLHGRPA